MRLLPPVMICLALLPGCKTDPVDPGGDVTAELVAEDEFAATAAETLCAQLFACECGDSPFTNETEPLTWASEAECVAEKQPDFQAVLDNLLSNGAVYSAECGGEYIANFLRPDCESLFAFQVDGGHLVNGQICPLAVRERPVGQECESSYGYSYVNDCGEGKLCSYDYQQGFYACVEVGELPVQQGDSCQIFDDILPCADGLYCVPEGDGRTCQPARKVGDPCPDYACWGADLTCQYETMTCQPNAGVGESCESTSCAAGLYCDGGQEFTCQAQFEFGHGCVADSVCAQGGECIDNICTPPAPAVCGFG